MIPASYLFKDLYQQHWEEDTSTPTLPVEQTRFTNGLTTPIYYRLAAILRKRDKAGRRYFGVHAYD
jgi:hypothetical protein